MTRIEEERIDEVLTAYELQVLIGTSIYGCSMSPAGNFNLVAAWSRLRSLGLIDRADGLAIATNKGSERIRLALELKELHAQGGVRVAPLEWHDVLSPREDGPAEPSGDYEASNGLGSFYYIRCYFGSDSYGWEVSFDANAVSDHDNPEDAKASAFEHHKRNVLSALETEAAEPVLWWVVETMPSGVKRWQCVEHKYDAQKRADDSPHPATVTPLYAHPPHSSIPTVTDGSEEQRIEDLRFKAFRTNSPADRQAYFDAAAKWFVERHYRYAALSSESKP